MNDWLAFRNSAFIGARSAGATHQDADDSAQDAYLKAVRYGLDVANPAGYGFMVGRQVYQGALRRISGRGATKRYFVPIEEWHGAYEVTERTDDVLDHTAALAALTPAERIRLARYLTLKYPNVAERVAIMRLRKRLHAHMNVPE